MASFDVEVFPGALREWSDLPTKKSRREVAEGLEELRDEPVPPGSFRVVEESKRRLYLRSAAVVYLIDREARKVWVLEVSARRRVRR